MSKSSLFKRLYTEDNCTIEICHETDKRLYTEDNCTIEICHETDKISIPSIQPFMLRWCEINI
jgi:hypothetical protein